MPLPAVMSPGSGEIPFAPAPAPAPAPSSSHHQHQRQRHMSHEFYSSGQHQQSVGFFEVGARRFHVEPFASLPSSPSFGFSDVPGGDDSQQRASASSYNSEAVGQHQHPLRCEFLTMGRAGLLIGIIVSFLSQYVTQSDA
jgi:hypothetical protein